MRMMRWVGVFRVVLAAVAVVLASSSSTAFDKAGHFYTAYALVKTASVPPQRLLMALCAQLPDMAEDLDATVVYRTALEHAVLSPRQWSHWVSRSSVDNEDVARMVVAQQQLHALTGGQAAVMVAVAQDTLSALRQGMKWAEPDGSQLCAVGFALHFYGDTRAHRQLAAPTTMYETGLGHAGDLHYPDYALCDALADPPRVIHHCRLVGASTGRYAAWRELYEKPADSYDETPFVVPDPKLRAVLEAAVRKLAPNANDFNDWEEPDMELALNGTKAKDWASADDPYEKFISSQHSDRPCEEVLADALKTLSDLKPYSGKFTCAEVWKRYAAAVRGAFARNKADARKPLGTPFDAPILQISPLLP